MRDRLERRDVERIFRDVLITYGWSTSAVRVEPTPAGWHVMVTDGGNGVLSTDLIDGPPALVRTALTTWVLNQH